MQSNSTNLEKQFYADGFYLGMKALEEGHSPESQNTAIKKMYSAVDDLIDTLAGFAEVQGRKIDCKKGCQWCCFQPVFALDYELDYLKSFIGSHFSTEKQKEVQKRAEEKNRKLSGLNNEKILDSKHACPLLENRVCTAYEARPMACRIYLSTNVNTCLKFYHNPEDKNNYPALLDFPLRAGRMMNEGFKAALKANGINSREFRIEEKLISNLPPF